jgi:hypothetical protein
MVEANIFVVFLYSNVVNKMLKIGLDVHTLLDWKWGLPKLIFGYLVGMSSFRWWVEHSEACSGWLDGFMEDHRYDSTTRFGRPTPFAPSTCVPSCKHPTKILSRGGGYGSTSRFGRITKNLQNYFSMSCLLNAMVKSNFKFKSAWCMK